MIAQFVVLLYVGIQAAAAAGLCGSSPRALLVAAAVAGTWLASCRTTWLPFLGPTVVPTGALKVSSAPGADLTVTIRAPKRATKAVYWAAVADGDDPIRAYGGYANAGVADVTADGTATLRIKRPPSYQVHGKRLPPHVHYRWAFADGLLSGVRTIGV